MSGDTKRVLEVNQIDNLQGSTQRVKQETTLNNLRGVTQRVYVVGGGSAPVIDELNVTPSTSAQTITAPSGVDGYSPVNVSAVDSSIDANIQAGNIKEGVEILGVTGNYKGTTPTGTKSITANGVYDVTDFASADVQVPTTAPEIYRVFRVNNGKIENSISTPFMPLPSTATDIGNYCYPYAYSGTPASVLSGVINLSSLTTISGASACYDMFLFCTGITSVDLSNLTTISGGSACSNMFSACTGITSVDLSGLTTISGGSACSNMFDSCSGLTSVNLSGLTTISGVNACGFMFTSCTGLASVDLSNLTTISGTNACVNMFRACTSLTSLSFPALTSASFGTQKGQFNNLISGVTGCTIHFPSNLDPQGGSTVISSLSGYPNFSGTNTVLMFDLPATES